MKRRELDMLEARRIRVRRLGGWWIVIAALSVIASSASAEAGEPIGSLFQEARLSSKPKGDSVKSDDVSEEGAPYRLSRLGSGLNTAVGRAVDLPAFYKVGDLVLLLDETLLLELGEGEIDPVWEQSRKILMRKIGEMGLDGDLDFDPNVAWRATMSPELRQRLWQLGWWRDLRDFGYEIQLLEGELGEVIGISDEQRMEIREHLEELRDQLTSGRVEIEWMAMQRLGDLLDEGQRKELTRRLGERRDFESLPAIELTSLQMQLNFSHDFEAEMKKNNIEPDYETDRHLPMLNQNRSMPDTVFLLERREVQRHLDMTSAQINGVISRLRKRKRVLEQLVIKHSQARQRGGEGADPALLALEMEQAHREAREEIFESILLPVQVDTLERLSSQVRLRRLGIVPLLAYGSLGKELEVTSDQRRALLQEGRKLAGEIPERRDEIIAEHRKRIERFLTGQQRAKLAATLGDPPGKWIRFAPIKWERAIGLLLPKPQGTEDEADKREADKREADKGEADKDEAEGAVQKDAG